MTTTLETPVTTHPAPATIPPRRDNWTVITFGVAAAALILSVVAIGFGARAIDESKGHAQAPPTIAPASATPVALSSVTLGEMRVTPSSTVTPAGNFTITVTNSGMMAHELLVFHTSTAPENLQVEADGKVAEDAPGFMISDGENLDPGASQTRVIDLSQPGTYLFVCNLPGHFSAGMHTVVTVK
jgi:uncharacterized cupredoxin-like copper-binding protein